MAVVCYYDSLAEAESGSHNVGIPARLTLHALATVRIHAQGAADYQQLSDGSLRSSIKSREQTSPSWGKQVLGVGAGHHTDCGEVSRGLGCRGLSIIQTMGR